ncbi:MAG: Ppx/GppA family phosphatase, partial [Pseudobdellovibrionaceae bacterium]
KPTVDKLKQHKFKKVVAVAGTPTSIAAIEVGDFIEEKVHGFVLSQDRLKYWLQNFAQKSVKEKQDKYQLGGRADIIFIGTLILHTFLEMLNQDSLLVSTKGVRYGLAEEMLRASHSAKI